MPANESLAGLAVERRNQLEQLLMDFEQNWRPDSLAEFAGRIETSAGEDYRRLALVELVKIDLQRGWSAGQGRELEAYGKRFPLLRDRNTLPAELILVEFQCRREAEPGLELETYNKRFPRQFEELSRLAAEAQESNAAKPQASIETSRIAAAKDTLAPRKTKDDGIPQEFGRYRILRELGSGAMGTVHLAHDTQLDRQVAIKTPNFGGKDEAELITRFYREAQAAAKLQHRNICPIYDVGEINGRHFMSMGFIKGRSLQEFIKPDQLPPPKTAAMLILRVALAMAEAHRHNVVHRDLKPANIMIDLKKEPVVMDFGLARKTDAESRMTQSGMLVGSPAYMSPEQVTGDQTQVGPAADIYGLGVILYELLTGDIPFRGSIAQVVYKITSEEPKPPSELRKGIDPRLEAICAKMMAKRVSERYQSMEDVAADLKAFLKGQPVGAPIRQADTTTAAAAETSSGDDASSESQVLNAFFAEQAATNPLVTAIERTQSPPRRSRQKRGRSQRSRKSKTPIGLFVGAALAGLAIVALGIVFLWPTPEGMVRVEVLADNLDELEVLIGGDSIDVTSGLWEGEKTAKEHRLALKIGGVEVPFDAETKRFQLAGGGRLAVMLAENEITSDRFEVVRDGVTRLRIEFLPEESRVIASDPPTPAAADSTLVPDSTLKFGEWTDLFNRSDLAGWRLRPSADVLWRNEGGRITGRKRAGVPNSYGVMVSENTYRDFHFSGEVLAGTGEENSMTIFFRTEGISRAPRGERAGYALNNPAPDAECVAEGWGHGSLHANVQATYESRLVPAAQLDLGVRSGEWFTIEVLAVGESITIRVNGKQTATYRSSDPIRNQEGPIILQCNAGESVYFRNFRIRELLSEPDEPVYELRTYVCEEGQLDALHARFRDHTLKLLEKHGIANVAYWTPTDPETSKTTLIYLVLHKSRDAAAESWRAFLDDPEWQRVEAASQAILAGPPQSVYLRATDYSPEITSADPDRVYELRIHTASDGKLAELHQRFRDRMDGIFHNHGMVPWAYWQPLDEPDSENKLVFILEHDSEAAARESWQGFFQDPQWQTARDASEVNGRLVQNIERTYMTVLDFSPRVANGMQLGSDGGWTDLFNGQDLTGWTIHSPGAEVEVQRGAIVAMAPSNTGWIATEGEFTDFELELEYKLAAGGNSGVFLRIPDDGQPQGGEFLEIQLIDDAALPELESWQRTGSVYGVAAPSQPANVAAGEWHKLSVRAVGPEVTVSMDDREINRVNLDSADSIRGGPFTYLKRPSGHIGLQLRRWPAEFRNIRIREISEQQSIAPGNAPASPAAHTPTNDPSGDWTDLFNGRDLTGWRGLSGYWHWEGDELVGRTTSGAANFNTALCSDRTYGDFEIQFEAKLEGENPNSGLQIRSEIVDADNFIVSGPQVDIGDRYWGGLYGERLPGVGIMKAADENVIERILRPNDWNAFAVRCVGKRVTITINGTTTVDDEFPSMADEGYLGWQLHRRRVMTARFRNMRIREF